MRLGNLININYTQHTIETNNMEMMLTLLIGRRCDIYFFLEEKAKNGIFFFDKFHCFSFPFLGFNTPTYFLSLHVRGNFSS